MTQGRVEIFRAGPKSKEWCARVVARNGRELMRLSETYKRKAGAFNALEKSADIVWFAKDGPKVIDGPLPRGKR